MGTGDRHVALLTDTIRVLHVDDDTPFSELVTAYLERESDRIHVTCRDGAANALDYLADNHVDCVVSDYEMPGRNGIELLEAVRDDYPDLPFILFTGKGGEEVASDAISAGVTDYLQKEHGTNQFTVLANRVENAVERDRSARARRTQPPPGDAHQQPPRDGLPLQKRPGVADGVRWRRVRAPHGPRRGRSGTGRRELGRGRHSP